MAQPRFVIDQLFPLYEVNLITGPSGVGKTTIALQMLRDLAAGNQIFGFDSHPAEVCYIACDRSLASLESHMRRLGLEPAAFPHASLILYTGKDDHNVEAALRIARAIAPQVKILFLDGFASLCSGRINYANELTTFLKQISRLCQEERITVIGTVYSGKAKEGSGYASPRDRIAGSAIWSCMTAGQIIMEFAKPAIITDPYRTIHVIPQESQEIRTLLYSYEGSQLALQAFGQLLTPLDAWLAAMQRGDIITSAEFNEAAAKFDVSTSTLTRWRKAQIALGTIFKRKHGEYMVADGVEISDD